MTLKYPFLFILVLMSLLSCNRLVKRLYFKNKTRKSIILTVDTSFIVEAGSLQESFKQALDGKNINKDHFTISFGKGRWAKDEEESLKTVLQHTRVTEAGNANSFILPVGQKIGHGLLIPELIITINEPE